jgi:hypothetical protein
MPKTKKKTYKKKHSKQTIGGMFNSRTMINPLHKPISQRANEKRIADERQISSEIMRIILERFQTEIQDIKTEHPEIFRYLEERLDEEGVGMLYSIPDRTRVIELIKHCKKTPDLNNCRGLTTLPPELAEEWFRDLVGPLYVETFLNDNSTSISRKLINKHEEILQLKENKDINEAKYANFYVYFDPSHSSFDTYVENEMKKTPGGVLNEAKIKTFIDSFYIHELKEWRKMMKENSDRSNYFD